MQITVAESIGIENRGAFYEETGASRDVLQNHLLQLVSLIAMEPPATFDADSLRDEKVKVLRAIAMEPGEVVTDVVRGQYGPGWVAATKVPGYREEPDVDPQSETETFVAAKLQIDDWRWSGVPFYVRTGKRLPKRATEIAIQYREVPHRLFRDAAVDPDPNLLVIRVQPDEGIMLRFGAKVPGLGMDVRSVTMDFTYGSAFNVDSPDAYETLILDALQGDASLFTRADEVEEAWSIVDPLIEAWAGAPEPSTARTTTRGPGDRPRRTSCSRATGAAGAGSSVAIDTPAKVGEPVLRWSARADSIAGVEAELVQDLGQPGPDRRGGRRARSARRGADQRDEPGGRRARPEVAEHCAAAIQALTGRHPSRTVIIGSADPDGPSWLDARVEAVCVLPREDAPETCAEMIRLTAGGEAGRHLGAIATPLILHDLPVTVWWPGEPPFGTRPARDLLGGADRLVVDGSTWSGDGLDRLTEMAALQDGHVDRDQRLRAPPPVALARGHRLDLRRPRLPPLPALAAADRGHVRDPRRDVRAGLGEPGQARVPRRLARLAAGPVGGQAADRGRRARPVDDQPPGPRSRAPSRSIGRGLAATLSDGRSEVGVVVRPMVSTMPAGTTLRVELLAERRGSELRADVTAEAETVHVRVWQDGVEVLDRHFLAPRRTEVELLAEAIESGQRDPVGVGALRSAAALTGRA